MHIGLDFDNTIVTYDRLFHRAALERGLVAAGVPRRKREVRDAIRLLPGGEDLWTELQGVVYGRRMPEAEPAPGVEAFLAACSAAGVRVSIISHKTEFPAIGERVNLRDAARSWLAARGLAARHGVDPADVLFLGTLAEKLAAIAARGCAHFVDDLVEVLGHPAFPPGVERILYAPPGGALPAGVLVFETWEAIGRHLLGEAR
jgi:phosphoglycolate phosphatase-like HAD superfamily hydrolase